MSLSDLASIGSLVSVVAVVVSLIYMSQQTRQNTKHTKAQIQQGRTGGITDWLNALASDPSLLDIYLRGTAGDPLLSDVDAARFVVLSTARFYSYEDQFYQHKEGLLDDVRYTGVLKAAKSSLKYPGSRASWTMMRDTFDAGFQTFMDDIMRETRVEPAANFGSAFKSLSAVELSRVSTSRVQV
jgi:hypothetical protein